MRRIAFGLVFALVATTPAVAQGQGWIRLPNGQLGYVTDYTSSGFWHCNNYFINANGCKVNGQSVTLSNAGNTLTLTYTGFQNRITALSRGQRAPIGQITKSFTGTGPFTFPTTTTPNAFYLAFGIVVTQLAPLPSSNYWTGGYLMRNNNLLPVNYGGHTVLRFNVTPPPEPFTYSGLLMHKFTNPAFTMDDEPMVFDASVSVTPEPATLILVGSGLAGVFGAVARRRRRRT